MSCHFCSVLEDPSRERWIVHEDAHALVLLHDEWATLGHAVVASKRHVENLSALDHDERIAFMSTYAVTERILLEETGAGRAVVMKLGIAVPHLHLHIYPVSSDASRAEVMAAIDMKTRVTLSPEEQTAFARKIRTRLSAVPND
jgi:diadenosine tetraphosphate (Ap4A) HIT family hydrolase